MKNFHGESRHGVKLLIYCMLMTICFICFVISVFAAFVLACALLLLPLVFASWEFDSMMKSGLFTQVILYGGAAICLSFIFLKASRRLNRLCNQLVDEEQALSRGLT